MIENILLALHGATLLLFGISLTAAFSGIHFTKRNFLTFLCFFVFSGGLQLVAIFLTSKTAVWKLYPLITHIPLVLLLCFVYQKTLVTALVATFSAYLLCQPSKWFGVLVHQLIGSDVSELSARIIGLITIGYVAFVYLSPHFSELFNKDKRSVCIFGFIPTVYYIFDYVTTVYTDLWLNNAHIVMEFPPFFLAVMYMIFCFVYHKEYEQKADAKRKEQIIRIAIEQQTKEIAAVRQTAEEVRLLRHDMRMFLSSVALAIENGETDTASEMINAHISRIEGARLEHFCTNDIVNCVISDYAARCKAEGIPFFHTIELEEMRVNEILFASILSNALDNAVNAQRLLPISKRNIKLMLKNSNNKLLLSVKNPIGQPVIFSDGLPVSREDKHGYGTQSIRYLTERLGGNCQFSVQDNTFILRVVL